MTALKPGAEKSASEQPVPEKQAPEQQAPEQQAARKFTVTLAAPNGEADETFACAAHETVLDGMARLGRRGIPVGCRGGGCGVCKVEVRSGAFACKPMSRAHVSEEEQKNGRVLACRILPAGDMTLTVIGKMTQAWACRSDGRRRRADETTP